MQRLILLRHADAERASASGDFHRRLTAAGGEDARRIGRALAARGLRPDLALVSAAERARQTWDAAHDAFGDVEVELDRGLYNATLSGLQVAVAAVGDRCETLIVVGHNPGLHQFAVDLMLQGSAAPTGLEGLAGGFPTAGAAVFVIDAAGHARYEMFLTPADAGEPS